MKKSCCMVFGTKYGLSHLPELFINFSDGTPLERVNVFKYLGLWMDPELTFKPHIVFICKRIYGCLGSLYHSINCFSFQLRKRIISQLYLPYSIMLMLFIKTPLTPSSNLLIFYITPYADLL